MTDITLIYVFHVCALKSVIYLQNEPKNALVLLLIHYGSIIDINVFLQYIVLCLRALECGCPFKFSDEINFVVVLDTTQNNLCNLHLKGSIVHNNDPEQWVASCVSDRRISLFGSQFSCMRISCSNFRIIVCFGTRRTELYSLWGQAEHGGRL